MIILGPFQLGIFCNSMISSFYFCSKTDTIPSKADALRASTSPGPPAPLPWALRGSISAPDGKESTYQRAITEKMPKPNKASWIWLGPGRITEYRTGLWDQGCCRCSVSYLAVAQVPLLAGLRMEEAEGRWLLPSACACHLSVRALLHYSHRAVTVKHYGDGKYL